MHLIGGDKHQGPQAGLVQAREHHPGDDKEEHHLAQNALGYTQGLFQGLVERSQDAGQVHPALEALDDHGDEFNVEHVQIDHHAHGHFKEH